MKRVITVAAAGFVPCQNTREDNAALAQSFVRACAKRGAALILLPEEAHAACAGDWAKRYGVCLAFGEAILYDADGSAAQSAELLVCAREQLPASCPTGLPQTVFYTAEVPEEEASGR